MNDIAINDEDYGRRVIWGLTLRFIGLVCVVQMWSLSSQVEGLMSSRSFAPVWRRLDRIRKDFSPANRYWQFPSLFWINSSDEFIKMVPFVGMAAGTLIFLGGPWTFACLIIWRLCALAIHTGTELGFPWDCFLFESGFLALFMPSLPFLTTSIGFATLPNPLLCWAYRFLFFRMMGGFGKVKFQGMKWRDRTYIKTFLINMYVDRNVRSVSQVFTFAGHCRLLSAG